MGTFSGPRKRLPPWLKRYAEDLTQAERSTLVSMAQGRTARQIAEEFELSTETIEQYIGQIYQRLGIRSRAALFGLIVRDLTRKTPIKTPPPTAPKIVLEGSARQLVRMLHVAEPIGFECVVCNIRMMFATKTDALEARHEHVIGSDHRRNNRKKRGRKRPRAAQKASNKT
jgi:DNA-binding CsgD family transcriptional regulator